MKRESSDDSLRYNTVEDLRREYSVQRAGGSEASRERMMQRQGSDPRKIEKKAAKEAAMRDFRRHKPTKFSENVRRGMESDLRRYLKK